MASGAPCDTALLCKCFESICVWPGAWGKVGSQRVDVNNSNFIKIREPTGHRTLHVFKNSALLWVSIACQNEKTKMVICTIRSLSSKTFSTAGSRCYEMTQSLIHGPDVQGTPTRH